MTNRRWPIRLCRRATWPRKLRRSEPVTDLRRAIGINDKFLMIRDLFGGDAAAYEAAIGTLNGFDDFDECMIYTPKIMLGTPIPTGPNS